MPVRRGAEVVAALVAALAVGLVGPASAGRAAAQGAAGRRPRRRDRSRGGRAGRARRPGDPAAGRRWTRSTPSWPTHRPIAMQLKDEATSREQLEARLVAQSRSYAVQRYMYGSTDTSDLLAFLSALNKPADDAVWGLATLEVTSQAALDQAQQVAKARAAIADRLAEAESDVLLLRRRPSPPSAGARRHQRPPDRGGGSLRGRGEGPRPGHGQRHDDGGVQGLPPGRGHPGRSSSRGAACAGSCWPPSARRSPTTAPAGWTPLGNSLVVDHRHPDRCRHRRRQRSTATPSGTTRSGRCSSSPPRGSEVGYRRQRRRQGRSRATSSTPPLPPGATSAGPPAT